MSTKALLFPCLLVRFDVLLAAHAHLTLPSLYDQSAAYRNSLSQVYKKIQAACKQRHAIQAEALRVNSQYSTELCTQITKLIVRIASNCDPRTEMPVLCPASWSAHLFASFVHFTVCSLGGFDRTCIWGLHLFIIFQKYNLKSSICQLKECTEG